MTFFYGKFLVSEVTWFCITSVDILEKSKMRPVLFTTFLLIASAAYSQSLCYQPELLLPDTVGSIINPALQKSGGCDKPVAYHIISYKITVGRGASASMVRLDVRGAANIGADAKPGDRITVEITEAQRESNGQRQNLPLGKWARKTAVFRQQ